MDGGGDAMMRRITIKNEPDVTEQSVEQENVCGSFHLKTENHA